MQLFPSEVGGVPEHPGAAVKEIVRVFPEESVTTKEKSAASITQGSGSGSSSGKGLGPVDVSETYRRRTGELSAQSAPDALRQPSDSLSPLSRPGGPPSEPEGSRFITPRVKRMPAPMPTLPDRGLARIAILIVIAVALGIATYFLRSI
jgi:hypothetical protein